MNAQVLSTHFPPLLSPGLKRRECAASSGLGLPPSVNTIKTLPQSSPGPQASRPA